VNFALIIRLDDSEPPTYAFEEEFAEPGNTLDNMEEIVRHAQAMGEVSNINEILGLQ
jgi:hypothetical protein